VTGGATGATGDIGPIGGGGYVGWTETIGITPTTLSAGTTRPQMSFISGNTGAIGIGGGPIGGGTDMIWTLIAGVQYDPVNQFLGGGFLGGGGASATPQGGSAFPVPPESTPAGIATSSDLGEGNNGMGGYEMFKPSGS
jgi:hypothetical protein